MRNLWYENAIFYSLDVETYMDSDGDGVGDFPGLTKRLDYLAGLGVTCLWLLPFYPSSERDNGYDVTDYYNIDPRFGNLGDFVEFMHQARQYGIRVVVDLVVNHTSSEHPWFQAARCDKHSKYRDYYVWADEAPEYSESKVAFPGIQDSIWTYDEQAGQYYLHRFYKEQPDLNIDTPAVREEIEKIMGFWLELGVSGFRVDAASFLIESVRNEGAEFVPRYNYLRELREFLLSRRGDAVFIAEANVEPEKIPDYFGNGDRMQMLFNFLLNQYVFLALARQEAAPIRKGLEMVPEIPHIAQWLNFLRHHDELNIGGLTEEERQDVFAAFAPEEKMQIYGRGIRRRLAPMLGGDRRRIELAYSLLFSLPGTPMLRYGDEIDMGDDLSLPERESVRTVMQWSSRENGGFSSAPADKLVRPTIAQGEYGYQRVNVAAQHQDPQALLNWIEKVIRTRKKCPEFGWGKCRILETESSSVFAHSCEWGGSVAIAVHNLAEQPCKVTLDLSDYQEKYPIELFADRQYEPIEGSSPSIQLEGYGYRWFAIDNMP